MNEYRRFGKPEYDYSRDEWLTHFDEVVGEFGSCFEMKKIIGYFERHYPNRSECIFKAKRFLLAMGYMLKYAVRNQDFEQFIVTGEINQKRAYVDILISRPLVVALWRAFSGLPDFVMAALVADLIAGSDVLEQYSADILEVAVEEKREDMTTRQRTDKTCNSIV
jgi:hypothetical protein